MSTKTQKALQMIRKGRTSHNDINRTVPTSGTIDESDDEPPASTSKSSDNNPASTLVESTYIDTLEETSTTSTLSTEVVCTVIRSEFENIRKALTCSICLCTYRDAVMLSTCIHAYCRDCLTKSLKANKKKTTSCPQCQVPCTRRSIMDAPNLNIQVKRYKQSLRKFGLAPAEYTPTITTLTQLVDGSSDDEDNDDNNYNSEAADSSEDEDINVTNDSIEVSETKTKKNRKKKKRKKKNKLRRTSDLVAAQQELLASKTFARVLRKQQYAGAEDNTNGIAVAGSANAGTNVWLKEQDMIVAANEKTLVQVAVRQHKDNVKKLQEQEQEQLVNLPTFSQVVDAALDQEVANNNIFTQDTAATSATQQYFSAVQSLPPSQQPPNDGTTKNHTLFDPNDPPPFSVPENLSPIEDVQTQHEIIINLHDNNDENVLQTTSSEESAPSISGVVEAKAKITKRSSTSLTNTAVALLRRNRRSSIGSTSSANMTSPPYKEAPTTGDETRNKSPVRIKEITTAKSNTIRSDEPNEIIDVTMISEYDNIETGQRTEEIEIVVTENIQNDIIKIDSTGEEQTAVSSRIDTEIPNNSSATSQAPTYTSMTKKAARFTFGKQVGRVKLDTNRNISPDGTKKTTLVELIEEEPVGEETAITSENLDSSDDAVNTSNPSKGRNKSIEFGRKLSKEDKIFKNYQAKKDQTKKRKDSFSNTNNFVDVALPSDTEDEDAPASPKKKLCSIDKEITPRHEKRDPEGDFVIDENPHEKIFRVSPTVAALLDPVKNIFSSLKSRRGSFSNDERKMPENTDDSASSDDDCIRPPPAYLDERVIKNPKSRSSSVDKTSDKADNNDRSSATGSVSKVASMVQAINSRRLSDSTFELNQNKKDPLGRHVRSLTSVNDDEKLTATPKLKSSPLMKANRQSISEINVKISTNNELEKENGNTEVVLEESTLDVETLHAKFNELTDRRSEDVKVSLTVVTEPVLEKESASIVVGSVVEVQARTWPGVNQPGGVAKVEAIYKDDVDGSVTYDVRYVLDKRREKKVDAVFVKLQTDIDSEMKTGKDSERRVSDGSTKSRSSRRISPAHKDSPTNSSSDFVMPAELRAELLKEGCDVEGSATQRVLDKIASNSTNVASKGTTSTITSDNKEATKTNSTKISVISGATKHATSLLSSNKNPSSRKQDVKGQTKKTELQARAKEVAELAKVRKEVWHKKGLKKRKSDEMKPAPAIQAPSSNKLPPKPPQKPKVQETKPSPKKRKTDESRTKVETKTTENTAVQPVIETIPKAVISNAATGIQQLPLLPSHIVCQKSDEYYENLLRAAIAKGSLSLVSSFLSTEDEALLKELCKQSKSRKVKVSLLDEFKQQKTILCILPATAQPGGNLVANWRSLKAMQACMDGIPMVCSTWLDACRKNANQFVLPEPSMFVRSLPTKTNVASNADFGVAKMACTWAQFSEKGNKIATRYAPFRNMYIYLCGFSCKNESDFSALARQGGAKEVITKPLAAIAKLKAMKSERDVKYVVLCNDTNVAFSDAFEKEIRNFKSSEDVLIVNSFWLFDSISCAEALPPTSFKPQGSKAAKDLWKLACKSM